jgi:thiol:disulfide interchange protein
MAILRPVAAWVALALVATACNQAEPAGAPVQAPFVDLAYEQALERARADDRVVLLDFTASWCPPCKAMEADTWPDPGVKAWIEREAVALKVDVDREGRLAGQMGVSAVPTIVFLDSGGRELGRFSGYRDPEAFLREAERLAP